MNNKIIILVLSIIIVVFISFIYIYRNNKGDDNYNMKMYIFNAGKADCILISNNGKHIMIDTGEENLATKILSYLRNNNITKLDYLIITHFDKDHVGSASKIIDNIQVDNVLQSNYPKESTYYANYISSIENKGIVPQTISGDVAFTLGELNITVNGPTTIYDSNESNNSSLIVSIKYNNTGYLFMGDSQNNRIKDYLNSHSEKYSFIKIPYHGNYQKTLEGLLEVVNPNYAIITCSSVEPDTSETEGLLNKLNIKYYLTKNGDIKLKSDGESIMINQ